LRKGGGQKKFWTKPGFFPAKNNSRKIDEKPQNPFKLLSLSNKD
jgi:hypothetical protein